MAPRTVVGVILAGGLARRMGGGDKGLRLLGGKPMLQHVVDRLRPQVADLVINANGDPARLASFALPVVADPVEGFVGPLAGVLAGMRWAAAHRPEARWVASVSSDAPFLPGDLVGKLTGALTADGRPDAIALARSAGDIHPVIGLWPVHLADDLEGQLIAGVRKVLNWTDRHGTVAVDFPTHSLGDAEIDPFFNANTPEELTTAEQLFGLLDRKSSGGAPR